MPTFDPKTGRHKPLARGTVPLALDNDKTRDEIARRDRLAHEKKLVEKYVNGDLRLTDAQRAEAAAIQQRWGVEAEERRRSA